MYIVPIIHPSRLYRPVVILVISYRVMISFVCSYSYLYSYSRIRLLPYVPSCCCLLCLMLLLVIIVVVVCVLAVVVVIASVPNVSRCCC